jgi:predicted esterase
MNYRFDYLRKKWNVPEVPDVARLLVALACFTTLAAGESNQSFEVGRVLDPVVCRDDSDYSYALYLPTGYVPDRAWPVLLAFDARGRGGLAVDLFREAAERLGYVVIGSNDVASDGPYDPNLHAVRALLGDAQARLAIDDQRMYAAGFSGGARFACDLGFFLEGRIAGVIAAGAGFSSQKPPRRATPFAFFGTIGRADFNYYELRELEETLRRLDVPHRVVYFDGGHAWPPAGLASQALEWMHRQAMKDGEITRSDSFIDAQFERAIGDARAMDESGQAVEALLAYRALVSDFEGLHDVDQAAAALSRLEQSPAVRKRLRTERKQDEKDRLYVSNSLTMLGRLGSPQGRGLTVERLIAEFRIDELRAQLGPDRPARERLRATRLLENVYVQTAFYVPRRVMEQKDYRTAVTSLSVAARIKPDEPGVHYNLGCARARAGDLEPALAALKRAVELGFSDADLLASDPDLERLREKPEFRGLLEEVRQPRD